MSPRFGLRRRTPPEVPIPPVQPLAQRSFLPAGVLKGRFDSLLSEEIRPLLREHGFAKSGTTFLRRRAPLYDLINFQGSDVNGTGMLHRFYVNVGIGSVDMDARDAAPASARPKLHDCLVSRRWGDFVGGAPVKVELDSTSDLAAVAVEMQRWLSDVVTVLDAVDSTSALVDLAIERNYLHQMQKTCAYLARLDDLERLRRYLGMLRQRFETDLRWAGFNRTISEAIGSHAGAFRAEGLLDDVAEDRRATVLPPD